MIKILCSLLIAIASSSFAQVDFWSTPNQSVSVPDGTVLGSTGTNTQTVNLGPLSTSRSLTQEVTDPYNFSFGFGAVIQDGVLYISNPTSGASRVTMIWGESGDMNLDLLSYGDSFQFSLLSNDLGSQLTMSAWNGATEYSTSAILIPYEDGILANDFSIPFSSFGAADFTDVDRISFSVNTAVAADMAFGELHVATVPEPSSALLVSLLGLAAIARRRRGK